MVVIREDENLDGDCLEGNLSLIIKRRVFPEIG